MTTAVSHEMRGQNVDVVLVGLGFGILLGDRGEALVPVRHGDRDAVGFRGARDVVALARRGEVSGGYAARELGISRAAFMDLLAKYDVPQLELGAGELERQVEALVALHRQAASSLTPDR